MPQALNMKRRLIQRPSLLLLATRAVVLCSYAILWILYYVEGLPAWDHTSLPGTLTVTASHWLVLDRDCKGCRRDKHV